MASHKFESGDDIAQEQMIQMHLRSQQEDMKKTYAFWETQPVAQFTEDASTSQTLEVCD